MEPDTILPPGPPPKLVSSLYELAEVLCSAVFSIALLFTFLLRFAGVVGFSMTPTLNDRDWLGITSYLASPKRGTIVIISPRTNNFHEPLVKRIVALEGDVVDIKDGKVWINDVAIDEPYLPAGRETEPAPWYSAAVEYPVTVPRGRVFVLGDNRGGSTDSRYSDVGFIRADDILGRVLFRLKSAVPGTGMKVE